jgi:hypothetical protein
MAPGCPGSAAPEACHTRCGHSPAAACSPTQQHDAGEMGSCCITTTPARQQPSLAGVGLHQHCTAWLAHTFVHVHATCYDHNRSPTLWVTSLPCDKQLRMGCSKPHVLRHVILHILKHCTTQHQLSRLIQGSSSCNCLSALLGSSKFLPVQLT